MTGEPLSKLVDNVSRRRRVSMVLRAILKNTIIGLGALLLFVGIDAVYGLPPVGLLMLDSCLAAVAIWYVVSIIREFRRARYTAIQTAAFIEEKLEPENNPLINALSLSEDQPKACSEQLLSHAISQGAKYASEVDVKKVVDWRPSQALAGWLGGLLLGLLVIFCIIPGLFISVGLRMMEPLADHPAYTRNQFSISVTPNPVVFGDHTDITIDVSGPALEEQANISVKLADGKQQTLPLLPRMMEEDSETSRAFIHHFYSITEPITFCVWMGDSRSRWYTVDLKMVPKFKDLKINYNYPAYTQWKETETNLDNDIISALEGTRATVSALSNLPLKNATLTLESDDGVVVLDMAIDPDNPRNASATFTVSAHATYKIELESKDGSMSEEPRDGKVIVITDQKPTCSIVQPEPHLLVPPNWTVPIHVEASDDIGVDRIDLHLSANGWGPFTRTISAPDKSGRHVTANSALALETLGVEVGDVITMYATAFDAHPNPPGFSDSSMCIVEIISMEEYKEMARQRYRIEEMQKEWDMLMEDLEVLSEQRAEILDDMKSLEDKLKAGETLSDADKQRLQELTEKLDEYNKNLAQVQKNVDERVKQQDLYEFEAGYKDALKTLSDQLQEQSASAHSVQSLAEDPNRSPEDLAKAMDAFRRQTAPFNKSQQKEQKDIEQDLEKLQMANQLQGQAARLQGIIAQQRELAKRLAAITNKENPSIFDKARLNKIAEEQELLREELKDVTQKLGELGEAAKEQLPKMSASARKIAQALEELSVTADQKSCSQAARQPDVNESLKSAELAAEKLESLQGECNGMGKQPGTDLDGCLSLSKPQIPTAMDQMRQGFSLPGQGSKSGYGMNGARGRVAFAGPLVGMNNGLYSDKAGRGRALRKRQTASNSGPEFDAESLNPDNVRKYGGSTVIFKGVPIRYQRDVSAYFKRIADEQNEMNTKKKDN